MLPNALSPNRSAACAVLLNWSEGVCQIGTATAPLAASVRGPACRTRVSILLLVTVMVSFSCSLGRLLCGYMAYRARQAGAAARAMQMIVGRGVPDADR